VQLLDPATAYLPLEHTVHWSADGAENSPVVQGMQADEPSVGWDCPASHCLHTELPKASAYWPAGHFPQLPSPVVEANCPTAHCSQVSSPPQESLNCPAGQPLQDVSLSSLYVPAAQHEHNW